MRSTLKIFAVLAFMAVLVMERGCVAQNPTWWGLNGTHYSPPPGPPLTYNARTDNCVTGSESGCIGGRTTGEAGSAMAFQLRPSDSLPFADITTNNANASATGTDSDFGDQLIAATDEHTAADCLGSGSPWAANWNMGSAGEYDAFSLDSKILLVTNQDGNSCLLFLNPAAIHAKTCASASPACVVDSGIGTTNSLTGTAFNWSTVPGETNVLYGLASLNSSPASEYLEVERFVICRYSYDPGCSGQSSFPSVISSVYVDMTNSATSLCGSNITLAGGGGNTAAYAGPGSNTWTSTFLTAKDGSVAWGTGGAQDYNSTAWTPLAGQTFILPTVSNSSKHVFEATAVSGATSGTEPTWGSCSPTCTDGGVTWTDEGTVGGQGPGFTIFSYVPGTGKCSMYNTRSGYVYRGSGSSYPGGQFTTQDGVVCTKQQGSVCSGASTVQLPDRFTLHDLSIPQSGGYIIASPTGGGYNSSSWNWPTLSGQASNAAWTGSAALNINNGVWSNTATYAAHDVVVYTASSYPGNFYTALVSSTPTTCSGSPCPPSTSPTQWALTSQATLDVIFTMSTLNAAPCTDYQNCTGHQAQGQLSKWYNNTLRQSLYSTPVINGKINPATQILQTTLPDDFHGSCRNCGPSDLSPVFTFDTSVPASSAFYTAACYLEVCAFPATGPVGGVYTEYRMGHEYNSGSNPYFGSQNNIGVVSYLGDLVAFGTDMMGTRGDSVATTIINNKSCQASSYGLGTFATSPPMGYYRPSAGNTVNYEDTISFQNGANGAPNVYQAYGFWTGVIYITTGTGTEGSPVYSAWNTGCPSAGNYCTSDGTTSTAPLDGTVLWRNLGPNTCRSDVFILDALSSHIAP